MYSYHFWNFNYLFLNVILPLVKSYADNSTTTLSPTKIRTKFFLIFPEIVAKITCLEGSISTRNMALGRDSTTRPVTCTTSSLGGLGLRGPSEDEALLSLALSLVCCCCCCEEILNDLMTCCVDNMFMLMILVDDDSILLPRGWNRVVVAAADDDGSCGCRANDLTESKHTNDNNKNIKTDTFLMNAIVLKLFLISKWMSCLCVHCNHTQVAFNTNDSVLL